MVIACLPLQLLQWQAEVDGDGAAVIHHVPGSFKGCHRQSQQWVQPDEGSHDVPLPERPSEVVGIAPMRQSRQRPG